jgi:hypothetical protein
LAGLATVKIYKNTREIMRFFKSSINAVSTMTLAALMNVAFAQNDEPTDADKASADRASWIMIGGLGGMGLVFLIAVLVGCCKRQRQEELAAQQAQNPQAQNSVYVQLRS